MPDFSFEDEAIANGHRIIAGVDEAGRGPWAGPVVAGAVVLDRDAIGGAFGDDLLRGLDDSKKLKAAKREALFEALSELARDGHAHLGVGIAEAPEIDAVNILQATFLAMKRAVDDLGVAPEFLLIDGNRLPVDLPCAAACVIKGDGRSFSIAAGSIVAKVTRDRIMADLAKTHPEYGWERNAGYGTKEHSGALDAHGVTSQHRKSFAPIHKILSPG